MTVNEKIKFTARGYRTVNALVPGHLTVMGIQAVFSSLLPFVNIFMSAKILTALADGENFRQVFSRAGKKVPITL